jgi:transposase-like protein
MKQQILVEAVHAVKSGEMSIRDACRAYGIKSHTRN